jgi:hypothetical protein
MATPFRSSFLATPVRLGSQAISYPFLAGLRGASAQSYCARCGGPAESQDERIVPAILAARSGPTGRTARLGRNARGASSCERCRVSLSGAVFLRRRAIRLGRHRLGHVGWGFQLLPDHVQSDDVYRWAAGSVENTASRPFAAPGRSDFWCGAYEEPWEAMLEHRYDEYKLIIVDDAFPEAALHAQAAVQARPYVLLFSNCVNAVTRVLGAFGASLPSPSAHLIPNDWYDHIPGPSIPLTAERPAPSWQRAADNIAH